MHNKINRGILYIQSLEIFIESEYNITITKITEAKRGFYGETWTIETSKGTFFVKIDYCPTHKNSYIKSFPIIEFINNNHIDYISKILKTKNNELYKVFNDGVLCIFEYVMGENTDNYNVKTLFEKLSGIYKLNPKKLNIDKENFNVTNIINFYLKKFTEYGDSKEYKKQELFKFLIQKEKIISRYIGRLKLFANICKNNMNNFFITHGDAGGNVIIDKDKFTIIDWDGVFLSPLERDVWFYYNDNEKQIKIIQDTLNEQNLLYTLDINRIAYYTYYYFFYYITEFFICFDQYPHSQNKILEDIKDLFTGWVKAPLNKADEIAISL